MQVDPSEVIDIQFVQPVHTGLGKNSSKDFNALSLKMSSEFATGPHESPHIKTDILLSTIHKVAPNSSLFTIVSFPSVAVECTSRADTMSPAIAAVTATRYNQSTIPLSRLPLPLTALYDEKYKCLKGEQLLIKAREVFQGITISESACEHIELQTCKQRECREWHEQRKGRITASSFHEILVFKSNGNPQNIIRALLVEKDLSFVPAIKWGIEHEETAKQQYTIQMQHSHEGFKYDPAGFVINPLYPHLGASPDGFIECKCCGRGLLEVKCPLSYKDINPQELKLMKLSCIGDSGLKKTHKYYTQVQGQLGICSSRNFCDFVVWTQKGLYVERIYKNLPFVEQLVKKLTTFYVECLLPEIMTQNILDAECSKNPQNSETLQPAQSNSDTYCFCKKKEYGKMIQCDNPSCKFVWFHYACVGIKRAPKGNWYCFECQLKK